MVAISESCDLGAGCTSTTMPPGSLLSFLEVPEGSLVLDVPCPRSSLQFTKGPAEAEIPQKRIFRVSVRLRVRLTMLSWNTSKLTHLLRSRWPSFSCLCGVSLGESGTRAFRSGRRLSSIGQGPSETGPLDGSFSSHKKPPEVL